MSRRKKFPLRINFRLFFRIFALVASFATIEYLYSSVIQPRAQEAAIKEEILFADDPEASGQTRRSFSVILKDTEQQICMSLLLWSFLLLIEKYLYLNGERRMLRLSFINLSRGERIIPGNALNYYRDIRSEVENKRSLRSKLLPQFLLNGLHRFHSTHSISAVSEAVQQESDLASEQMDSDLALIRYIGWAIPSIGFIGTVRGIGEALAQAEQAIEGDISGVTNSLGLAFNSTLVALLFSIILTFFVYMFQSAQDNFILQAGRYCRENLMNAMKVPIVGADAPSPAEGESLARTLG